MRLRDIAVSAVLLTTLAIGNRVGAVEKTPVQLGDHLPFAFEASSSLKFPGPIDPSTVVTGLADLQDLILSTAKSFLQLDYVPYIWGGGRIGTPQECLSCRECVGAKKVPLASRLRTCAACQSCGMDCSHFVNHVFAKSGLTYRYATSWELGRQSRSGLLEHYNMIDIGSDLALAQPGDILVYARHIAILTKARGSTHGDIIHATRFRGRDYLRLGGFRHDVNQNLKRYRGKLLRILRHRAFFENPNNFT